MLDRETITAFKVFVDSYPLHSLLFLIAIIIFGLIILISKLGLKFGKKSSSNDNEQSKTKDVDIDELIKELRETSSKLEAILNQMRQEMQTDTKLRDKDFNRIFDEFKHIHERLDKIYLQVEVIVTKLDSLLRTDKFLR